MPIHRVFLHLCLFMGLSAWAAAPAWSAIEMALDAEDAFVAANWDLWDSGTKFASAPMDKNNVEMPIISTVSAGSGHSVKFKANPYVGIKQRVEQDATRRNSLDVWRYYGMRLKIDGTSDVPSTWTVIHQLKQDGTSSGSPIGALGVREISGGMGLYFVIRNTQFYNFEKHRSVPTEVELWGKAIAKDTWYDVVIGFRANGSKASTTGGVKIWFNGALERDWTGDIGYPNGYLGYDIDQSYSSKFGIYRGAQSGTFIWYLDTFLTATTYAEANVGGSPLPPALPNAPTGLIAAAESPSQISLAWTDASSNETGFAIERSTSGGSYVQAGAVAAGITSFVDGGLVPSTTYTYRVRATNGAGDSAYSNTASATTAPYAPTLFSDDFNDGNANGWTVVSGTWAMSNGTAYKGTTANGMAINGQSSWTDYSVQARVKKDARVPCILARYSDSGNFYNLEITNTGLDLWKIVGGTWTRIGTYPTAIANKTWYTLTLSVQGTTITGSLDGVERITATDASHLSGRMGLRSSGGSTSAVFDDVLVEALPAGFMDMAELSLDDPALRANQ